MKIREILNLDIDGFPIASIDKSNVVSVGPVKESENGPYQLVILNGDGHEIKIRLKNKGHFLSEDYEGDIKVMSGKPVRSKPTGIIFRLIKGRPSVNITENATLILSRESESVTLDIPSHGTLVTSCTPSGTLDITSKNINSIPGTHLTSVNTSVITQLTEKEDLSGIEEPNAVLIEESRKKETVQEEGPSDATIIECFNERLHVLNILHGLNRSNNFPFTVESLYPMVTSIIIDANRAGKKILPLTPHVSKKKKFEPYEKPHNPVRESVKAEASMNQEKNPVNDYLLTKIKTKEYQALDTKGNMIGDVMTFPDRRAKAVAWMLKNKATGIIPKAETLNKLHNAIEDLVGFAPTHIGNHMIYEAIAFDRDPESKDMVETVADASEEHEETDPIKLAMIVFSVK